VGWRWGGRDEVGGDEVDGDEVGVPPLEYVMYFIIYNTQF
jgi:hypothetical protein